jgi:hypothetical protein
MASLFSCFSHQAALLNPVTNRVLALIFPYANGGLQKILGKISSFACEHHAPSRTFWLRFVGLLFDFPLLSLIC